MNIKEIYSKNGFDFKFNEPLAKYTTIKIGGKAKYFVKVENSRELLKALKLTEELNLKYFLLGKGSNVIFSDNGFDGLIIMNESEQFLVTDEKAEKAEASPPLPRYEPVNKGFNEDDKNEFGRYVLVKADSGMQLGKLMKRLFAMNIVGLEYFAGIPATIGGAIYMNIHGANKFFSEYVHSALLFGKGKTKRVTAKYFGFDYDWSVLHQTGEVVIWAKLKLPEGNGAKAADIARKWAEQKAMQPRVSAGCVFKNISPEEKSRLNIPSYSSGYVIDKLLGLKGISIGGAKISEKHAAFIENTGSATAGDVIKLIKLVRSKAKEKLNLNLELEVEIIGEEFNGTI